MRREVAANELEIGAAGGARVNLQQELSRAGARLFEVAREQRRRCIRPRMLQSHGAHRA